MIDVMHLLWVAELSPLFEGIDLLLYQLFQPFQPFQVYSTWISGYFKTVPYLGPAEYFLLPLRLS